MEESKSKKELVLYHFLTGETDKMSESDNETLREILYTVFISHSRDPFIYLSGRTGKGKTRLLEDFWTREYSHRSGVNLSSESTPSDDSSQQLKNIAKDIESLRSHLSHLVYDQGETLELIDEKVTKLTSTASNLAKEIHERLIPSSFGIEEFEFPMYRFVPVRVYLSNYDEGEIGRIIAAIGEFIEYLGFLFSDEFPSSRGSWWKNWIAKSKNVLTSEEVRDGLLKGKRALELAAIEKVQSEVNKNHAEAASNLIGALSDTDNAAVQIGSLLLVKVSNSQTTSIITRQLTTDEIIMLEKNQSLLHDPNSIIRKLEALSCNDTD